MSLWITWEVTPENAASEGNFKEGFQTLFENSVQEALRMENVETPVQVSLTIVDRDAIQEMNRDFRGIDRVTDVLSFPMLSYEESPRMETPASLDVAAAAEQEENLDPDSGEVVLGDIVICLDKAKEQAAEYGHSLERELSFLSVHSMLHLLGYDHETKEQEQVMFSKQEAVLEQLGLSR
ncbi:MAG: rRNA maturation RNase YbeY [Firmicutes bacterium]|nr:rRNA maturation RNase YbeY [Bacillota bacterium]